MSATIKGRPESPDEMQSILKKLAELLARFADPKHRWQVAPNPVPGTGVAVKQIPSHPHVYKFIFYTPDDIAVMAQVDLKRFLKNYEQELIGLLHGVAEYLLKKREPPDLLTEELVERAVDRYVDEAMNKSDLQLVH